MHEAGLMAEAMNKAETLAMQCNADAVAGLTLRVGVLSGVALQALQFAFDAMKPGTVFEQAELRLEQVLPRLSCRDCGMEYAAQERGQRCPVCKGSNTSLLQGGELELAKLELIVREDRTS